jgi:2-furoyl-CoA dehydrogenase large subunit
VKHLRIRNRVVLTNKTPSGLVRGFGGPQVYFALERLMQRIAATLGLDPLEVIRRNLVATFPYRGPAGAVLDSGDCGTAVDLACSRGGLTELRRQRDVARADGRLDGIGFAAVVEPSISNMGYITTVLSQQERQKASPKGGAQAAATVALDPLGCVSVAIDSVPQGQGHRTVTAQIVADVFGLTPAAIRVDAGLDTGKDAWSIAAGNYSSRFAGATAGAAHLAATRLRGRLARIAAAQLNLRPEDLCFAGGRIFAAANPENSLSFARVAAARHWFPGSLPDPEPTALRETVFWSPSVLEPPNAADEINSSASLRLRLRFLWARDRPRHRRDLHRQIREPARRRPILNPVLFGGQVRGGFAMAIGAALYERLVYAEDGGFLTGSFADYAVPTASMIPELEILHQESPSPVPPSRPRPGSCRRLPRSSAAGRASQKCRTTTSKSGAADRERGIGLLQWTALKRTSCVLFGSSSRRDR